MSELVKHSFARIKVVEDLVKTVFDEPFVMKAVEEYFSNTDPYLEKEIQQHMQLSNSSSSHEINWHHWTDALNTVSVEKIESHAKDFREYCLEETYIDMITAYPAEWAKLIPRPDIKFEDDGTQQVVINVKDSNFGKIFTADHIEFIDRLNIYE
ncbi:hypothetical protein BG011_007424 [Mortierella polycephala]|uniref:Uncharacterized protein n=1 Tax=Mortierella polycephala TaxID=41804 RepID=A0A9P6PTH9_9FUNG|nr:hypothetical protein BG011_007424 [Mortierella polycephala]